jgi:orotate phosphoribosyltransferase-like protein
VTLLRLDEKAVSWTEVDGEILALEHESSTYISTNRTATILWTSLANGASREQLIGTVMQEFEVNETTAAADVDAFVDALSRRGLLVK